MENRIVEFPNRYRVVPVEGFSDIVDLIPVPGTVTSEGTKFAKETMLSDQTADTLGLGAEGVPDEAFRILPPVGTVLWYASENVPAGYLICDGSAVLKAEYPLLYAVIGSTFGEETETEFYLPDLRAAFIRGAGENGNYSAAFGETQEASLAYYNNKAGGLTVENPDYTVALTDHQSNSATSPGSRTGFAVRPYNVALTPIIKY